MPILSSQSRRELFQFRQYPSSERFALNPEAPVTSTSARGGRRRVVPAFVLLCAAAGVCLMSAGCKPGVAPSIQQGPGSASKEPDKIKICYLGLTCEPAIFVAYEKGFFKEEGVDVELVKSDWTAMRDGLADGR